jgi:hypothetical protein
MRIFKTKWTHRWAAKEGLTDASLRAAVDEMRRGLVDADLGGCVYKKRVALPGKGKSGSVRTLLAFKQGHHVFFVYGFAKSARANISDAELKALRRLGDELLSYADTRIDTTLGAKELIEVVKDDE